MFNKRFVSRATLSLNKRKDDPMETLKLVWFSLHHLSALGYWQAGAEMFGGDDRRAYADAHRALQMTAAQALQEKALGAFQRAMLKSA